MRTWKLVPGFTVPGLMAAALLSGCIITSSGSHGSGSSNGDGGFGGQDDETVGVGGDIGTGGSGGGATCVDPVGEGSKADCDLLNIAPGQGAGKICGPEHNEAALGYGTCLHAYEIYTSGAADELQACLSKIGVEDACTDPPVAVNDCVAIMYEDACDDPAIAENCDAMADDCAAGETFVDRTKCIEELRPLNNDALQKIRKCYDVNSQVPCATAYTDCYDQLLEF